MTTQSTVCNNNKHNQVILLFSDNKPEANEEGSTDKDNQSGMILVIAMIFIYLFFLNCYDYFTLFR